PIDPATPLTPALLDSRSHATSRSRASRPGHRCGPTVIGYFAEIARLAVDDRASSVDGNPAAVFEHVTNLLAAALHSRLHPRKRDPDHLGGVLLRKALELGERDRFAVGRRKSGDEKSDAVQKVRSEFRRLLVRVLDFELV